jgi:hypothetical protein
VEFNQVKLELLSKAQLEHAGAEWSIGDANAAPPVAKPGSGTLPGGVILRPTRFDHAYLFEHVT